MCSDGSGSADRPGQPDHQVAADAAALSSALGLYGVAYVVMHVAPAFLHGRVWSGLTVGDLLSLFTPYVVGISLVLVWRRLHGASAVAGDRSRSTCLLLVGFALYTSGHGINLAANAIARHLVDVRGAPLYQLTDFLDEHLGHVLWHAGVVVVALGLLLPKLRPTTARHVPLAVGGICFAFAYFTDAVEGQTVPMMLPAAIVVPLVFWLRFRGASPGRRLDPVLGFYTVGFGAALVLFAIWLLWQGGFPQFSERGLL